MRHVPSPAASIRRFARVAPQDKLRKVTRTMQADGAHFALVGEVARDSRTTDESVYIVALEDVLEELVGEVRDATSKSTAE
jgi:CBS domain containing-hemolysin-like protein